MLKRIIALSLVILGLLTAAGALASATILRPSQTVTATASVTSVDTYLVTAPATLSDFGSPVTIYVTSPTVEVVAVEGQYRDIVAWLGADPAEVITGLRGWENLELVPLSEMSATPSSPGPAASATPVQPSPSPTEPETTQTPAPEPSESAPPATDAPLLPGESEPDAAVTDPRGSDMWLTEFQARDALELQWQPTEDFHSLLIAGVGEASEPLTVSYTWDRVVGTPLLAPGLVLAFLLIASGVGLELWHRREVVRKAKAQAAEELVALTTGGIPVVTPELLAGESPLTTQDMTASGRIMTRRELRELREQLEQEKLGKGERTMELPALSPVVVPTPSSAPTSASAPSADLGSTPPPEPELQSGELPAVARSSAADLDEEIDAYLDNPQWPGIKPEPVAQVRDPKADAWRKAWGFNQPAQSAPDPQAEPVTDDFDDAADDASARHSKFFRHRRRGK